MRTPHALVGIVAGAALVIGAVYWVGATVACLCGGGAGSSAGRYSDVPLPARKRFIVARTMKRLAFEVGV